MREESRFLCQALDGDVTELSHQLPRQAQGSFQACNEENIQAQTRNGKAFTAFNFQKAFWFIVLTRARAWK